MKRLILLFALALAGPGALKLQVGESCDKSANFRIDSFDVTPWPIMRTQEYTMTINGVFLEKEYLHQIYVGTKHHPGEWHYTYLEIMKDFAKNAVGNFTVTQQGPSITGAYVDHITFHRRDFSYFACWQYDYVIDR